MGTDRWKAQALNTVVPQFAKWTEFEKGRYGPVGRNSMFRRPSFQKSSLRLVLTMLAHGCRSLRDVDPVPRIKSGGRSAERKSALRAFGDPAGRRRSAIFAVLQPRS